MSNKFGIPEDILKKIRDRDINCVYCGKSMIEHIKNSSRKKWWTIEHFRENGPFYWKERLKIEDLAICCWSCNSSRGKKKLLEWFKSQYCIDNNINKKTVAKIVKEYDVHPPDLAKNK